MPFSKHNILYESEATLFLRSLKKERPMLEAEQLAGRNLLWEKTPVSLDERARYASIHLPFDPSAPFDAH